MVLWYGMENWVRKITQPSTSASTQCLCIFYVNIFIYVRCTCYGYHEHYKATGDTQSVYQKTNHCPAFHIFYVAKIDDKYVCLEKNVLFSWHLSTIYYATLYTYTQRQRGKKNIFRTFMYKCKWFCVICFRLKSTYHPVMNEMIPTHHQIKLGWKSPTRNGIRKTYFLLRNMLYKQFFQLCIVRQVKGRPSSRIVIW